jgi:hypothetical protein
MISGATTCPRLSADSGGVDCAPGAPRSVVSSTCMVGLTAGVPPGLVSRARVRSAAPRNYDGMCRAVRVCGAEYFLHECAESLCLSAVQILLGDCVSCTRKIARVSSTTSGLPGMIMDHDLGYEQNPVYCTFGQTTRHRRFQKLCARRLVLFSLQRSYELSPCPNNSLERRAAQFSTICAKNQGLN